MRREELLSTLGSLGYPLVSPAKKKVTGNQILEILGELAVSKDSRLVEGFPVVLAICARRGLKLEIHNFLAKQAPRGRKRRNMEKLLLVASTLLREEKLEGPHGLDEITESVGHNYVDMLSAEVVRLAGGVVVSMERLRNALSRYVAPHDEGEKEKARQRRSFLRELHLNTLFSPKQKELISKKLKGEPLTKTEQEYYSRVVKKKLEALADGEVGKIARTLTGR